MTALLSIEDLVLDFDTFDGVYKAIDGVSVELMAGEALGIVGETGCGKSVTAKSVLGLVPRPPAIVRSGRIMFQGRNLLEGGEAGVRAPVIPVSRSMRQSCRVAMTRSRLFSSVRVVTVAIDEQPSPRCHRRSTRTYSRVWRHRPQVWS